MIAVLPAASGLVRVQHRLALQAPAQSHLAVRMLRAPINPADLLAIDGRYAFSLDTDEPLGAEGVGIVESVGPGVLDCAPGDLVLPLSRGNWCSHRVVERTDVIVVPQGIDPEQAAMLRINPATARLLLDATQAEAGHAIVQNGATSAVAHWVRRMAIARAIHVIDVVRRPTPDLPAALIDGPNLAERVRAAAGERRIRAALDCVAGEATGRLAECLGREGRVLLFGHLSGKPISVRSQALTGGGLSIMGFSLRPAEAALSPAARDALFAQVMTLACVDSSRLPVRALVPLTQIDTALALARDGGRGRIQLDLTA